MRARGLTAADLARELGQPEPTVRNVVDGKVREPGRKLRDALDVYLDAPTGTTLAIVRGELDAYPSDALRELVHLAQPLPNGAVEHLVGFLRSIS